LDPSKNGIEKYFKFQALVTHSINAPMVTGTKTNTVQMDYFLAKKPTGVKVRPMSTAMEDLTVRMGFTQFQAEL